MYKIITTIFIVIPLILISQNETELIINNTTNQTIPLDNNSKTDTIIYQNNGINTVTEIYINENLSLLSDDYFAKQVDELWHNAQANSPLNLDNITYLNEVYPELTTDLLKQRLEYLNSKTPFYVEYNEQLERIIKSFLKNRKDKYANMMAKAKYYFPLIEEQLAKHNIPLEMKYLAVVESALNPTAKSRVGATGLWQFMYGTGKQFDLNVSSYVDERNDVLKATIAACKFLNQLYATYNDWDLALAAYNSGPGNVNKAIRRSGGSRNYWNIRHFLPRETASYVPLFYTTMYIFEYANEHGIVPTETQIQFFQTDTIQVQKQITFDQITQAIPVNKNMLKFLNPQYKLEIIPVVKDRNYTLTLPVNLIGQFVQNEDRIYSFAVADATKREKPLLKYTEANNRIRYKVKSGDYLGRIAKRYGVSVSKIKRWNGLKSNNISIGQRLTIYPRRF
jgi:membrane-bound lytic murein transglycosylase D